MKKVFFVALICLMLPLSSCDKYFDKWSFNKTSHWHDSITNPDNKKDLQPHTASDWITVKTASEFEDGSKVKKCTVCGYILEEKISPMTHTHDLDNVYKSDENHHWKECKSFDRCHYKEEEAHIEGEWVVVEQPTTEKEGKQEKHCTVCSYLLKEEPIEKLVEHTHTFEGEYLKDEHNHWQVCTCGETNPSAHVKSEEWIYDKQLEKEVLLCSICSYVMEVRDLEPVVDVDGWYLYGQGSFTIGEWDLSTGIKLSSVDTGEGIKEQYYTKVELAKDDKFKFSDGTNYVGFLDAELCKHIEGKLINDDSDENHNFLVVEAGTYEFYLKVNELDQYSLWIQEEGHTDTDPVVDVDGWYLYGQGSFSETEWDLASGIKLESVDPIEGIKEQYYAKVDLVENDKFKFSDGTYYVGFLEAELCKHIEGKIVNDDSDENHNFLVVEAGTYEFYLKINELDQYSLWIQEEGHSEVDPIIETSWYMIGDGSFINGVPWKTGSGILMNDATGELIDGDDALEQLLVKVTLEKDDEFKLVNNLETPTYYGYTNIDSNCLAKANFSSGENENIVCTTSGEYEIYLKIYSSSAVIWINKIVDPVDPSEERVVFFTKPNDWDKVYVYCWTGENNNSWPGEEMSYYATNEMGQDIYIFHLSISYENIIFSDNGNEAHKTIDISLEGIEDNEHFYYDTEGNISHRPYFG